ncbi:hypothetical protein [Saliphagus infecundisoli]|uniref:DUF8112 domain-containing protein n=1 Tax=Saliphagus infecundisoli TaxID=1849069 RepID=A0ABD5QIF4_9EURY|nr:hypothetical protein [Saliphagus infecundisoli]
MTRTLAATPAQLFAGLPISSQPHVQCQRCGTVLYEGATVTLRAARPADSHEWTLQRVCCEACSAAELHPTLGYTELRLRCRLASRTDCRTQRTRLVVIAPTVLATSPPTESQTETDAAETRSHSQETTTEPEPTTNLEASHGR